MPIATIVETEPLGLLPTKEQIKRMRASTPAAVGTRISKLAVLTNQARIGQAAFAREQPLRTLTSPLQATNPVATLASSLVNPKVATSSYLAPKGFTRVGLGVPNPRGAQVDLVVKARQNQALARKAIAEGRLAEGYSRSITASAQAREAVVMSRAAKIEEMHAKRLWKIASTSSRPRSFSPHRYDSALAGFGDVWSDAVNAVNKAAKDVARVSQGAFNSAGDTVKDAACKTVTGAIDFTPPARKAGEGQEAYEKRVKAAYAKESAQALAQGYCAPKTKGSAPAPTGGKGGVRPGAFKNSPGVAPSASGSGIGKVLAMAGAALLFLR